MKCNKMKIIALVAVAALGGTRWFLSSRDAQESDFA